MGVGAGTVARAGSGVREPGDRAASRVFSISASGREELRMLLAVPPVFAPPRNARLLRVFFGLQMDPDVLRSMLEGAPRVSAGSPGRVGADPG